MKTVFEEMTASEADDIFIAAVVALDHTPPTSPYKEIFQRLADKYDFEKRGFAKRESVTTR